MRKFFGCSMLLLVSLVMTSLVSCSKEAEGVDPRFVGTWVRDASVSGVVESVYTLVLNEDGTASYSWYRHPKSSSVKGYDHNSNGTWRYDEDSNRIITDCISDGAGAQTVIFDVVSVTDTKLTVKMEGADKSRTYTRK